MPSQIIGPSKREPTVDANCVTFSCVLLSVTPDVFLVVRTIAAIIAGELLQSETVIVDVSDVSPVKS
jgi:hypothetical protein